MYVRLSRAIRACFAECWSDEMVWDTAYGGGVRRGRDGVGSQSFRIFYAGHTGPVCFLLHGGGHSSMSWAVFAVRVVGGCGWGHAVLTRGSALRVV